LRQGVKKIELLADPGAGEVRIGSTYYTGETFVTAVIERLSRRYPRMTFHLVSADETDTLYRDLHERKVDFLIARQGGRLSAEKLGFEILYAPSSVVVVGSQAAHRVCRVGQRTVGVALAGRHHGPDVSGHLQRQRSRLSSRRGVRQ
jgi:DNA-binding transcriptional LysR family regulator